MRVPKRSKRSRLWCTAYHEAGHAVMSYVAHSRIEEVSIVPGDGAWGYCKSGFLTSGNIDCERPSFVCFDTVEENRIRRNVEKDVMALLAGGVAEKLFCGRYSPGRQNDGNRAVSLLGYLADDEELEAYYRWVWKRTEVMLVWQPNWRAVEDVADLLVKRRRISGRLARSTILEARRRLPGLQQ